MSFQWSAMAAASLYRRSDLGLPGALATLSKRAADTDGGDAAGPSPPQMAWVVLILLNVVLWLPVLVFLMYTVNTVLPALAVVEDTDADNNSNAPPAYEAVAQKEIESDGKFEAVPLMEEPGHSKPLPIAAGVWPACRFLYATGGKAYLFRGMGVAGLLTLAHLVVGVIVLFVAPFLPVGVAVIIGDLATVQLSAYWLHRVISASGSSQLSFWKRLPSFKDAFRATALPILMTDSAVLLCGLLPKPLYAAMGVTTVNNGIVDVPVADDGTGSPWRLLLVPLVQALVLVLIEVPSTVALYRCQASLLPADEPTIVPFDRTFRLESVRRRGYATIVDAWKTFSWASWKRLFLFYVKIVLTTVVTEMTIGVIVLLQCLLVSSLA